jgi:hypothetical protein
VEPSGHPDQFELNNAPFEEVPRGLVVAGRAAPIKEPRQPASDHLPHALGNACSSVARFEVRPSRRKIVPSSIKMKRYLANEGRVAIGFCVVCFWPMRRVRPGQRLSGAILRIETVGALKLIRSHSLSRPERRPSQSRCCGRAARVEKRGGLSGSWGPRRSNAANRNRLQRTSP